MELREYLISYGSAGYFGRFVSQESLTCSRGDRVLIRSRRGLELGTVLGADSAGYADALADQVPGDLLRLALPDDERQTDAAVQDTADPYDTARRLAIDAGLPVEIIDAELILEPRTLVLHYLGLAEFDPRPFVSTLARQFRAYVELLDLAAPPKTDHEHGGCSSCGSGGGCGEGGCGSCGSSGGGCGTGCGVKQGPDFQQDWQAYFAELRGKMDQRIPIASV